MKTLKEYIAESATWMESPAEGDAFAFELRPFSRSPFGLLQEIKVVNANAKSKDRLNFI